MCDPFRFADYVIPSMRLISSTKPLALFYDCTGASPPTPMAFGSADQFAGSNKARKPGQKQRRGKATVSKSKLGQKQLPTQKFSHLGIPPGGITNSETNLLKSVYPTRKQRLSNSEAKFNQLGKKFNQLGNNPLIQLGKFPSWLIRIKVLPSWLNPNII